MATTTPSPKIVTLPRDVIIASPTPITLVEQSTPRIAASGDAQQVTPPSPLSSSPPSPSPLTVSPRLQSLLDASRALYVGLSEYRIGAMIGEAEIEPTEDAQRAATKIVEDLKRMIGARQSRAEEGA